MKRVRLTYEGAYHHAMNRGIGGESIFFDSKAKEHFIRLLHLKSKRLKIRIFAYCLMDNHYHLILQNLSLKLSDFMKELNGHFGMYYRKRVGGKGYVFQNRFKSTLIQNDNYLKIAIAYVLLNPARKGIIKNIYNYKWSSISDYFKGEVSNIVDNKYIEGLFGSENEFNEFLKMWSGKELPVQETRLVDILGEKSFIDIAMKRFNRRKHKGGSKRKRKKDYIFEDADKVIEEFEKAKGIKVSELDGSSQYNKRLRLELLVLLKDRAGLKYSEIVSYKPFKSLKLSSLGQLYKRMKKKTNN